MEEFEGIFGGLAGNAFFGKVEVFRRGTQVMDDVGGGVGLAEGLDGGDVRAVRFKEEVSGVDAGQGFGALVVLFVGERAAHGEAEPIPDKRLGDFHASGEGMDNASTNRRAKAFERFEHFVESAPAMEDDRKAEFIGDAELRLEQRSLEFKRRFGDFAVESDFPYGAGPGIPRGAEALGCLKMSGLEVPGMNAPSKGHFRVPAGDGLGDGPLLRHDGRRDHSDDARGAGVVHKGVEASLEFLRFKMAMNINELHGPCSSVRGVPRYGGTFRTGIAKPDALSGPLCAKTRRTSRNVIHKVT